MREVYEQHLQTLMLLLEFACTRAIARMRETTKKREETCQTQEFGCSDTQTEKIPQKVKD